MEEQTNKPEFPLFISLCDRGVNESNLHIHARNLFRYPSKVQSLDLSSNPFIDDAAF